MQHRLKDPEKKGGGEAADFMSLLDGLKDPDLAYAELFQAEIAKTPLNKLSGANLSRVFKINEHEDKSYLNRVEEDKKSFKKKINKQFGKQYHGTKPIILTKKNIESLLKILQHFVDKRLNKSPYFQAIFASIQNKTEREKLIRDISVALCHNLYVPIQSENDPEKSLNARNFSLFFGEVNSKQYLDTPEIYIKLLTAFKNKIIIQLRSFLGLKDASSAYEEISKRSMIAAKDYTKLVAIDPDSIEIEKISYGIQYYLLNFENNKEKLHQLVRFMQYMGKEQTKILHEAWAELLASILLVSKTNHPKEKFLELNKMLADTLSSNMHEAVQNELIKQEEQLKERTLLFDKPRKPKENIIPLKELKQQEKQRKQRPLLLDIHARKNTSQNLIKQGEGTAELRSKIREQLFFPPEKEKEKENVSPTTIERKSPKKD